MLSKERYDEPEIVCRVALRRNIVALEKCL